MWLTDRDNAELYCRTGRTEGGGRQHLSSFLYSSIFQARRMTRHGSGAAKSEI